MSKVRAAYSLMREVERVSSFLHGRVKSPEFEIAVSRDRTAQAVRLLVQGRQAGRRPAERRAEAPSQTRPDKDRPKTGLLWFEELAQFKESGKCGGNCQLYYMLDKECEREKKAVPRKMTLEKSVTEAKARYAKKYGADSWQWRDEGITFAVGNFLSSCEMLESDWDFEKREGIVAEVNWWLNQSKERKVK